jgi:nicotinamide riboside transporter PnuC
MLIELLSAVATVLAIAGVVLNNCKMIGCFYLWIVSNSLCLLVHCEAGLGALAFRDGIFILLALEGIWQWGARKPGACSRERKDAETIRRLKEDNKALEAMVAAIEKEPQRTQRK